METLLKVLKPIFLPLLKVTFTPPHLPEGSSLVRSLKPSQKWLGYRYLQTMFGFLNPFIGYGVAMVPLIIKYRTLGAAIAVGLFVLQCTVIGFALVVTRVDFELRHYLVGDRSLRVAQGAWKREEVTLSYANVQNIEVNQGPLERLFGFKSLTISTAGASETPGQQNSHLVQLVGLENADELRALILGMLQHHKDAGLGDAPVHTAAGPSLARLIELREAAFELRDAARAR